MVGFWTYSEERAKRICRWIECGIGSRTEREKEREVKDDSKDSGLRNWRVELPFDELGRLQEKQVCGGKQEFSLDSKV